MRSNYRDSVGPEHAYDVLGALQFDLLFHLGLREHHKLCDVGCGSLRAGRLFIPYLAPGNYYGIEPDQTLVRIGLEKNDMRDAAYTRDAHFLYSPDFDLSTFDVKFDYVLAQSIFSHAALHQIRTCLSEVFTTLAPDGLLVATYFPTVPGEPDYSGDAWVSYATARYCEDTVRSAVESHDLIFRPISFPHPWGQRWFLAYHPGTAPRDLSGSYYATAKRTISVL